MKRQTFIVSLFLLTMLALTASAHAESIPVNISEVEVENILIEPNATRFLDLERNQEFDVRVIVVSNETLDNVEVEASIAGYEFNDDITERIFDVKILDMDVNVSYPVRLTLTLPDEVDVDEYKLRIRVTDRFHEAVTENYNINVNTDRHRLEIEDVLFYPHSSVQAGQALLTTVRLENKGQREEDDVKVTVSIPNLGLQASDFVDNIEREEEDETEEIYLKLPRCAEPGVYDVNIDVSYNEGRDGVSKGMAMTVLENPACQEQQETIEVITPPAEDTEGMVTASAVKTKSTVRTALEVVLLVLVGLLVIIGLIIGFSKLRS